MPPKKVVERNLPPIKNELMLGEVDPAVLSTKCRVQDVRFGPADEEGTTETFVRIKTQSPNANMPHFIMRKAQDNYISATSMYRAVFHQSTTAQEKHEMEVVRRELAARSDENASGVWIPGTPDALELADVYGIRPWVQALLDAPTARDAYKDEQRSPAASNHAASQKSTPPPPTPKSVTASPSRKAARARSVSPKKAIVPPSARKVKKAAKEAVASMTEDAKEVRETVKKSIDGMESPISASKVAKPMKQVAELAKEVLPAKVEETAQLFSATVANAGQSMSEMVAEARSQVEAAQRKDAAALTESGVKQPRKRGPKRQAKDLEKEEEGVKDQTVSVKRSKVEDLEIGLIQEKRKVRALVGLVLGLSATAILPYLL